jgi:hypothetical protein
LVRLPGEHGGKKQGGASRPSQEDENLASDLVYFGNAVAAMRAALRRYHA